MTTKSIQIHFNAPSKMKDRFDNVLKRAGVNTNDAYRIFMQQTINHNGLPFKVTAGPKDQYTIIKNPDFNKKDIQALKEDQNNQGDYFNLDKEFKEVLNHES